MNIRVSFVHAAAITLAFAGISSWAAPVTFVIDSTQSSLTLSASAFGLQSAAQAGHPGSLVDRWSGTITADLTGGILTFSGGSSITALLNTPALPPFSTTPWPDVPAGSIDNYGVFASGLVTGVGLVTGLNGAYRSLALDITSGTASTGSAPVGMNLAFTSGHLEWGAIVSPSTPYGGSSSMVGVVGTNTSAGLATLTAEGVLTLPVQFHTVGSNRSEDWAGTLVAVVPEPSCLTVVLAGLGLVVARARGRARRI